MWKSTNVDFQQKGTAGNFFLQMFGTKKSKFEHIRVHLICILSYRSQNKHSKNFKNEMPRRENARKFWKIIFANWFGKIIAQHRINHRYHFSVFINLTARIWETHRSKKCWITGIQHICSCVRALCTVYASVIYHDMCKRATFVYVHKFDVHTLTLALALRLTHTWHSWHLVIFVDTICDQTITTLQNECQRFLFVVFSKSVVKHIAGVLGMELLP